jgi:hypothetical protein
MKAREILKYISLENKDRRDLKFTEVTFNNGVVYNGHLLAADQDMETAFIVNKWRYRHVDGKILYLNGYDIAQLTPKDA